MRRNSLSTAVGVLWCFTRSVPIHGAGEAACYAGGTCDSAVPPSDEADEAAFLQSHTSLASHHSSTILQPKEHADPDDKLPGNCGFTVECPVNYDFVEVERDAKKSEVEKDRNAEALALLHDTQRKACEREADKNSNILEGGSWCYDTSESWVVKADGKHADIDYRIPLRHTYADEILVSTLAEQVLLKADGSCCHSLTDLGAGVGQIGHALRARHPELQYYGYDGAGNVEEFTDKYVQFADLTLPLSLKRADWVISSEVGEHIPHQHEAQMIANIHAHNCNGVILTWAVPGQHGSGHVNCHSNEYLIGVFTQLGYKLNEKLTAALRTPRPSWWGEWLEHSAMAFDRITKPESCAK